MLDHVLGDVSRTGGPTDNLLPPLIGGGKLFWACKRGFDIGVSLLLVFVLIPVAGVLVVLNPFLNKGPLFYIQERMGRNCMPFRAIKFRSMIHVGEILRGHEDPIEIERITMLGRLMRKCRIDELPQIINVLKGEMSLIGPRPDYYEHAKVFRASVPGYAERHVIRPGISGLAQVEVGYTQGCEATRKKVAADLHYIRNAGFRMEAWLVWKTLVTIIGFRGA
ncbi:MAG: sugar transferase [Paracoccaceae bacterium]|nr:sugar transferase [Paracoccaceae bacterium]